MSAFALRQNDNSPYAAAPDLKLSTDAANPHAPPHAPTYIYNPVIEPGLLPPGIAKAPPTIGALTFNPPEEITAKIIHDLARPEASMMDIAERASTTIEALTLWMSRPDISARLDAIESAYARHVRLNIAACTPAIIDATARIITEYHHNESDFPRRTSDPKAFSLACRAREIALDACKILLKLKREHAPGHPASGYPASGYPAGPRRASSPKQDQSPSETGAAPQSNSAEAILSEAAAHICIPNTAPSPPSDYPTGYPAGPRRSFSSHHHQPSPETSGPPQSNSPTPSTASPYPSASSPPPPTPPPESP